MPDDLDSSKRPNLALPDAPDSLKPGMFKGNGQDIGPPWRMISL